jgi:hypothetical protein
VPELRARPSGCPPAAVESRREGTRRARHRRPQEAGRRHERHRHRGIASGRRLGTRFDRDRSRQSLPRRHTCGTEPRASVSVFDSWGWLSFTAWSRDSAAWLRAAVATSGGRTGLSDDFRAPRDRTNVRMVSLLACAEAWARPSERDTYPTAGASGAEFPCADHARFLAGLPSVSARCQSGFPRPQPSLFTHSFPRRPEITNAPLGLCSSSLAAPFSEHALYPKA